jgi:NAD(P)-dependent dehydrogenase (short-subunit alcohol dehydrogenase family)
MGHLSPNFEGETVIVTGAASGIGREIAFRFGDAGAAVIVADIQEGPKDGEVPTHELIRQAGGVGEFVETDVTDVDDLRTVVAAAREYGGVDVMINNAGIITSGSILDVDPKTFDRIHAVNARGTFFGTQAAANDMIEREEPGVVINTASLSSDLAQYEQVQYDSSKGAIRMITRGSALELASYGIRVNAVAPGQIATEMTEGWADKAKQKVEDDELIKTVPLDRAGTPEDIAPAYLYLASGEASYVTGEILHVDGGWQIF